jgi:hypothetical protein
VIYRALPGGSDLIILYYCLMATWTGLGDNTELFWVVLSHRPGAPFCIPGAKRRELTSYQTSNPYIPWAWSGQMQGTKHTLSCELHAPHDTTTRGYAVPDAALGRIHATVQAAQSRLSNCRTHLKKLSRRGKTTPTIFIRRRKSTPSLENPRTSPARGFFGGINPHRGNQG